jgi:hypothetical protein
MRESPELHHEGFGIAALGRRRKPHVREHRLVGAGRQLGQLGLASTRSNTSFET